MRFNFRNIVVFQSKLSPKFGPAFGRNENPFFPPPSPSSIELQCAEPDQGGYFRKLAQKLRIFENRAIKFSSKRLEENV